MMTIGRWGIGILIVVMLLPLLCIADTVEFSSYKASPYYRADVYSYVGGSTKVLKTDAWVLAIYSDDSNDGIDGFGLDETLLYSTVGSGIWVVDGVYGGATLDNITEFTDIFLRVYAETSMANVMNGSMYVDLNSGPDQNVNGTYTVSYSGQPSVTWTGGGSAADGTDWYAVPEPGTMSLFGLGILTLAASRKRRSKKT